MNNIKLKAATNILQAPYIKVDAYINESGITNGRPNIKKTCDYIIAPSAKKIATYIVNQIFGSDLLTQTEGLSINWLMPSLKEALELCVYEQEAFIYIHKFDNKIYLECIKKTDIHDLVQKFDKVMSCKIIQLVDTETNKYELHREIKLDNGITYLTLKAYELDRNNKLVPISINVFNKRTGNEYLDSYILPYEVLINVDIGQDFFKDSRKLLNEEMVILNTLSEEIEKTKTRIATSQHYQTGDIVSNWKPASTQYKVDTISVGKMQDYFTLLPGDRDHQIFQFLQGEVRVDKYITTFKFYDYQCIQNAGFSPVTFGYEKDAYQNKDSVDLNKNASDMTIEAIKNQIEPQINKLLENIYKAQTSQNIQVNAIPVDLNWDYGSNEKFDDMKKLQILNRIQSVGSIPYSIKAKIVTPILEKLIDDDYSKEKEEFINKLIEENKKEKDALDIRFGEV